MKIFNVIKEMLQIAFPNNTSSNQEFKMKTPVFDMEDLRRPRLGEAAIILISDWVVRPDGEVTTNRQYCLPAEPDRQLTTVAAYMLKDKNGTLHAAFMTEGVVTDMLSDTFIKDSYGNYYTKGNCYGAI